MNNLQKDILNKIKAGEIDMKPKWHFVLQSILWGATTLAVGLIAVYIFSFVLFALRESGIMFAPFYGWTGIVLFVVHSPWLLISVLGTFLIVLYVLVSHYAFSYRKPLVYSMIGLVFVVIAVSSFIQTTNFHGRAGDFVARHSVPGLTPLYRDIGEHSSHDITRGTVNELTDTTFILTTENGDRYTVILTERTKLPRHIELTEGDSVFVFGSQEEGAINAFGIRINDGRPLPPSPEGRKGERGERPPLPSAQDISPNRDSVR